MGFGRLFDRGARAEPVLGGIYSVVENREGAFGVVKVLAVDHRAVHVRIYVNTYEERPATVDVSTLTLGGGGPIVTKESDGSLRFTPPQAPMGIGHLPISHAQFLEWRPQFILTQAVGEDELDGYREWQNAGGGIWG